MRRLLALLTIIGFSGIAVFGVFAMNHGHGDIGCIAASAQGSSCPNTSNVLSFIAFHVNAFKTFSTATFGSQAIDALLIITALLSIAVLLSTAGLAIVPASSNRRLSDFSVPPLKQQFTRWLAFHENSPSLI